MVNWKPDSAVHCHCRCLKSGNPMATNTADIRQYITSAYSDEELTTLCFDYFHDVHDNFTEGMTKTAKIQLLLQHCQGRGLMPNLVAALDRDRPDQYREQFGQAVAKPSPAPLSPKRDPRQVSISPAEEITTISGGVNANAEQSKIVADVVVGDKVISSDDHSMDAVTGASVKFGSAKKQPSLDSSSDEEITTRQRISTPILVAMLGLIATIAAALITGVAGPLVIRLSIPPSPMPSSTPSCINADHIIVTYHIVKGTSEITTLSSGETISIEPNSTVYFQAEITPVTNRTLPPLECTWTNTGIATDGKLLHNVGCRIDYRSGRSADAVSMQLSQPSCPALAPYPFFVTPIAPKP